VGAAETVDVFWAASTENADEVLIARIRAVLGARRSAVGRLCPRCGSSDHGRPWARYGDDDVPVSLSRSGAHLVTVVAPGTAPVGVDVEQLAAIARSWPEDVLAAGETATTVEERTRTWAAKEAILKAEGVGLARAMDQVRIADHADRLTWLEAPTGFVAVLAR
jgi:4'-phosphopantetheinyl transferase